MRLRKSRWNAGRKTDGSLSHAGCAVKSRFSRKHTIARRRLNVVMSVDVIKDNSPGLGFKAVK